MRLMKKEQLEKLVKEIVENNCSQTTSPSKRDREEENNSPHKSTLKISRNIEEKIRSILNIGNAKISIQIIPASNKNSEE